MSDEPIVQFQGVTKSFGDLVVLDTFDLDVAPNEHISVIGPSGSGKSTLLRVLMTIERIDSGTIKVDGDYLWHMEREGRLVPANEAHLRKVRGKVGMVFQQFNLFPHMSALRNVTEAPIHVLGMNKEEATERAVELLKMVGLSDKMDSFPAQLSGGQQQRVAIARALAMRPKVMMFDEVTSALDPELVGEVLGVMRTLATEHALTMIIVTHQMGFAREISDRICFIEGGRIVEQGPPDSDLLRARERAHPRLPQGGAGGVARPSHGPWRRGRRGPAEAASGLAFAGHGCEMRVEPLPQEALLEGEGRHELVAVPRHQHLLLELGRPLRRAPIR